MIATIKKMTVQRNIIKGFMSEEIMLGDIDKKMCHNCSNGLTNAESAIKTGLLVEVLPQKAP